MKITRWIGGAFVLEGHLGRGAPAVWRDDDRGAICARVRLVEMRRGDDFDDDEFPRFVGGATLRGRHILPRLATYRRRDNLVIVDEDVGDITLHALIEAAVADGGSPPWPIALYIAAELLRARREAGDVAILLDPHDVLVGEDGQLWVRPLERLPGDDDDDNDDRDGQADPLDEVPRNLQSEAPALYWVARVLRRLDKNRVGNDDQDLVHAGFAEGDYATVERAEEAIAAWRRARPSGAAELAGLVHGLFRERLARARDEREERLLALPGARVEQEIWRSFEDVQEEDDLDAMDLDEVMEGRPHVAPYEPAVEPVDPFDDE